MSGKLAIVVLLLAAAPLADASGKDKTILFGINYLPQITCVEDFSPYWLTDNWTERRMVEDLKIMKAIGASCVRFHIYPAMPGKSTRQGVEAEKFLPMLDLEVRTANDLGLLVHLDIAHDFEKYGEEGVKFYVNRYKGRIESYQIGDEIYNYGNNPEKLKYLQSLMELIHSLDPDAKVTADLLVPDMVKIKKEAPDLYKQFDIVTRQYYPVTDHRGWNDVYIADLVDHLGNPTGRRTVMQIAKELQPELISEFGKYWAKGTFYDHPLYAGSYGMLDREVWITEITIAGYWQWGGIVPEDKRAQDWPKVIDAIAAGTNRVTRIYHHCFRDKMSWREYGKGQCGIVYYDGAPREATHAFKKMAAKYAPPDSPMRVLDCEIERVIAPEDADEVDLKVWITNRSGDPVNVQGVLELPSGAKTDSENFAVILSPYADGTHTARINVERMPFGNNHVFGKLHTPKGMLYAWGIISKPKRLQLHNTSNLNSELSENVRYVQGIEAVQQFLETYGDDCAIVTGPGLGDDMEMGYRLKSIIQALRCRTVPLQPSFLSVSVLDRPVIIIGDPKFNLISRTIEIGLPEDQMISVSNPGKGKGLINVVEHPFGQPSIHGRNNKQAEHIGYHFGHCPAALYIAGSDNAGTKAAVYDIIQRIWRSDRKFE